MCCSKGALTLWELLATSHKCQAQTQVDFTPQAGHSEFPFPWNACLSLYLPKWLTKRYKGTDSFLMHLSGPLLSFSLTLCCPSVTLYIYYIYISAYTHWCSAPVHQVPLRLTCTKDERSLWFRYHSRLHTLATHMNALTKWVTVSELELFIFRGKSQPRSLNSSLCCGDQRRPCRQKRHMALSEKSNFVFTVIINILKL